MINRVRGETGRIQSSLQADTFSGSLNDFKHSMGDSFNNAYGPDQIGLVWRMWKGWNDALHEGPAYGAMQKKLGEAIKANDGAAPTAKQIREAVDFSKTVAGDMRRLGASDMAKAFNASVPFLAGSLLALEL